ncbi:unnamed protein product [Lactuca saligna]|uniref:SWIM-type domain-containing protein n=1 Tax=Lactuca saligna TaxID=75948 RepID=A0AA36EDD3_LACSI|nr:unnamed protein product [Lactuca saligna]
MTLTSNVEVEVYMEDLNVTDDESDGEEYVASTMDKTIWDPFLNDLVQGEVEWPDISYDDAEWTFSNEETEKGDNIGQIFGDQYLVHNPRIPWNKMEPHLGEKYESPEQFKLCLTNYAVANGYQLRFAKCDRSRILVRCGKKSDENKCPFRCWASWMGNELTWQVKSLEKKHVCARKYSLGSLITPGWIANHYLNELIRNPKTKVKEMKADFLQNYSLKLSRGQCERARALAFTLIDGKLTDHYARIWDYGNEVLRSNPGRTVEIGVDVNPDAKYFKRIYICLKALKEGWLKGCRKVIDLDGCFLKGKVKGELIAAIGRDGNNQIYPIAWAVVNVENKDNWKWFIELLQSDIETVEGNGVTLISDQHKGLLEAVKEVMPHAEHRQCACHICANFYKHFSGEIYKTLFWEAAMSTTDQQFKNNMEKMKELNNDAYDDLMKRNPKTWCRAYFATDRACEAVENGVSESFNSAIVGARGKPLITMLEEIRLHVMERFDAMKRSTNSWKTVVAPKILIKMKKWHKNMRNWMVIPSGPLLEVRNGYEGYMVDLASWTCTCGLWFLSGLPCVHACAAINHTHQNLLDYEGHNARTCKNEKVVPPPKEKKPPGRPKKPHSDEAPSKRPTTSGGRGGRRPTRERGGRGSSVGRSGGRGGRSLIDEIFDSPTENEVINMFDNFEEDVFRAEMERGESSHMMQFPESQFDEGVPITQDDGVPETQFDVENANWEDQSHVVGGIAIIVPIIREKFNPRKPSG